jgi:hypothetical protein
MEAYVDKSWPAYKAWKQVVKKKQKLVLCQKYQVAMHDECVMAVVFGYHVPLLEKILSFSMPSEYESVKDLFASKVDIVVSNGNLVITNHVE